MKTYRKTEAVCGHPEEYRFVKTIAATVTCETTVIACSFCGEHLTEPKTEC